MINFRSYTDLNETIKLYISKIPKDIDLIVGIPRSGLLAANLIALSINKPLVDLEGFLEKKTFRSGKRLFNNIPDFSKIKKVLVIDDSLNSGDSLEKAKLKIKKSGIKKEIIFGIIYIKPGQEDKVDIYFEKCPMPRVFEWNLFHHDIISNSCIDIDGILCRDPTEEENDDGKKYINFIRNVETKIIPTVEISHLVTCRLEKYRKDTEYWLKKNNIKYRNLIMMPYKTKAERINSGSHGKYKAEKYLESNNDLFIESDYQQAIEIFNLTKKDVFSFENCIMLTNKSINKPKQIDNINYKKEINIDYNHIFRNKKSILVTFFSHSSQLAGAERSMIELIKELKEKNIFSHVVLPNEGPLQKELENISVPYDIVSLNWWANNNTQTKEEINFKNKISTENLTDYLPKLSLINPDLIYSNTIVSPWGAIAANFLNKPHIWHIREYGDLDHSLKFNLGYEETIKFIENNSDLIITNSKSVSEHISKYLNYKKPEIVYNYVEISKKYLEEKIQNPYKNKDSLKIIICGNIHPGKNQLEGIKAVSKLIKKNLNVELLILGTIGDKQYLNEILDYIKTNNIENNVAILDFVKNPYPFIKKSDIVLIPSVKEAYGRTAVEGMLLQKVVVANDGGGTKEIIKNGETGFVYKSGNIEELEEILTKLTDKKVQNKISQNGFNSLKEFNSKKEYGYKIANYIKKNSKILKNENMSKFLFNIFENSLEENKKIKQDLIQINQEKKQIEEKNEKLQQDLNKIQSSKTYKLWQKFNNIKKIILLPYRFGKYFLKSNLFFINFEIKKLFIKKTELKYLEEKFIIDGVSFIIPTWNKEEMVVNCVNNLIEKLEKEYTDIPKEIIVVDNGSADNTTKSIKNIKSSIPINVISLKKNIGFGPAVNLATEKSKYNYIYLLNNDMFPKDCFFSEIINFANNLIKNKKPFFGLSSQIFFYDQTKRREESGKTYITPKFGFINVAHCVNKSNLENNSITAYPGGGSSLINKYVFKEIGFYDYKSYTPLYCEDLDSGFVTWKLGFPNYYIANSHVIHHHRSSSKNLSINPDFIMHKNWLTFILKNFNNKSLYFKHILSYSLLCCLDKKYREYSNEVFKNKNDILNSKLFLTKFKNKYKEKDLINFIDFEIKNEF